MPSYRYSAYDAAGKIRKGVVDAPSSVRAGEILSEKGLVPVDIREGASDKGHKGKPFGLSYHALFCRGLASYLKRGVPLAEALKFLSRHSSEKKVAAACLALNEGVLGGKRLSAVMEETELFRTDLLRIVESGEKTSALPGVLEQAAQLYTLQDRQRRKIRAALTYPLAMTLIGIIVVTFLLVYVVPSLADLFTDMGQKLPLPTRILLGTADFLRNRWWLLLAGGILLFFFLRKIKKGRPLPFFRRIRENLSLSLVLSHLGTLLSAGIPLVAALGMAASMDSRPERWTETARFVKEGFRFDRALEKEGSFAEEVIYILRIGEMGGDLPGAIRQVAEMSWEEAQEGMERISILAEPVLVLFLGVAVGFVVIAILLPIFDLSSLAG